MPRVTPAQSRAAQQFTSWANSLDDTARAELGGISTAAVLDRWIAASGLTADDRQAALDMLTERVITVDEDGFLHTAAWTVEDGQ